LKALKRVECVKEEGSDSFTLVFEFGESEWMRECVVKKRFEMKD